MIVWVVVGVGAVALAALLWWSAGASDRGPGDTLSRRFRKSGGWSGGA